MVTPPQGPVTVHGLYTGMLGECPKQQCSCSPRGLCSRRAQCECLGAMVTNHHKPGGLKQRASILTVWAGDPTSRCCRAMLPRRCGGRPCPAACSSWRCQHPWCPLACGFITPISGSLSPSRLPTCVCVLSLPLLPYKELDLGLTWIIQDHLISRSLITSAKTLLPNEVPLTG